jgi:hypothetical protein
VGQRYLCPQLKDGLHQLTFVQILGKIFIGTVYNPASAKLSTWGVVFWSPGFKGVLLHSLYLVPNPLGPGFLDNTYNPQQ